jgi:DmsE family decaheme c-type cytochrome
MFLLANSQSELCYGCHADVRSQFSMPFKHRVYEGFMTCTDCHNPHGAYPPTWGTPSKGSMVKQVLGNEEACIKCHEEKRGPFVYEHSPVRVEGCEVCHYAHGSPNSRLLRRPVVFTMCLECHNGASGFSLSGQGVPVPFQFHQLNSPRYQNCTNCHSHIHGSNASAFFLK